MSDYILCLKLLTEAYSVVKFTRVSLDHYTYEFFSLNIYVAVLKTISKALKKKI